MKHDTPHTLADAAELRKRAEEKAVAMEPTSPAGQTPEEIQQMFHELRVHQIELEMQNEELRRAQAEIEEGRARYFDLYDVAPVGYCTVSETGIVLETNLTAATLLGINRGALIKQPISRFIMPDDQDLYYRHRKALLETGEPLVCELRMLRTDSTPFWARLQAAVVQGDGGEPLCRVVISNITETRKAEEQVRRLQKFESLGRMAGAVAHHFNNQLQGVMGNLALAISELPKGAEEALYSVNEAMHAARRAAEVSTTMLTYLGQTPGTRNRLDLSETCRLSLPMFQAAIPMQVVLTTDLPLPGPAVHANANQIQQLLTNLFTNAWEAIGDGPGTITMAVKTVSAANIPQTLRFPAGWRPEDPVYACLEVADTGCGIGELDLEKLFDPFFSTKFTGRGMGLAVVLGIVRAHGGVVTVESRCCAGSGEQGAKDGGRKLEVGGQRSEVRGQTTEDGRQTTEAWASQTLNREP
jgi:two-component system, cell cycle sensor histidine kinase and response regulator CckA